jgi:hypothetical protein
MKSHVDAQAEQTRQPRSATSPAEGLATVIDQSPAAKARRGLQEMADNRPQLKQVEALADGIDGSSLMVAQRQLHANLFAQRRETSAPKPNQTGLPEQLKAGVEALSGMTMDHVKVHYDSPRPAQLNAHAYAQGSDIHVAPGQARHLPHEAWHVVQQAQGRVRPTGQVANGTAINDEAGLEREADAMGMQALQLKLGDQVAAPNQGGDGYAGREGGWVVQREVYERGLFNAPEPDVGKDYESYERNSQWEMFNTGMDMFAAAAGDIISGIQDVPNMVLTMTTSTTIDGMGKTTLKIVDPTGRVRTSEEGHGNSASIGQWSQWLGDPNTRVGILVQLNPNELHSAAEVAHTLNHEVFLHAVGIWEEITHLKSLPDADDRLDFAVKHTGHPDRDHEDLVFGKRKNFVENQSRMIDNALSRGDRTLARQLIADYKADWTHQRLGLLKARAGMLWTDEQKMKKVAVDMIRDFGEDPDPGAQAEVENMRTIIDIINYAFEDHLDDVWHWDRIDLSPRAAEPDPDRAPEDLSPLPTGPRKKAEAKTAGNRE